MWGYGAYCRTQQLHYSGLIPFEFEIIPDSMVFPNKTLAGCLVMSHEWRMIVVVLSITIFLLRDLLVPASSFRQSPNLICFSSLLPAQFGSSASCAEPHMLSCSHDASLNSTRAQFGWVLKFLSQPCMFFWSLPNIQIPSNTFSVTVCSCAFWKSGWNYCLHVTLTVRPLYPTPTSMNLCLHGFLCVVISFHFFICFISSIESVLIPILNL